MQNKSPRKLLRDVKRITKYNERKRNALFCKLSISFQCQIDIPPKAKILSTSLPVLCDIKPIATTTKLSFSSMKQISIPPVEQIPPKQVRQTPAMNYQQFLCPSRQIPPPRCPASPPASRWIPPWAPPARTRLISPFGPVQTLRRTWSLTQILPPPVIVFPPSYSRVFPMAKIL